MDPPTVRIAVDRFCGLPRLPHDRACLVARFFDGEPLPFFRRERSLFSLCWWDLAHRLPRHSPSASNHV